MPKYIKALSLNKEIVVTGDVNCDLLVKNPKGDALLSFCASVNATQLIDKPTRVTKSSRSLLDVLIVSNPNQVKTKGVLELTISDHYLVHATLDLKVPTLAPRFITTRSFKRYKADLFNRAPVAQLVEHRAVTREVVSSTPAGPILGVFK